MPCVDPLTRSPGHLVLVYSDTTSGEIHKCSLRFLHGVDLTNTALLQTVADNWAVNCAAVVTSNLNFTDWQAKDNSGAIVNGAPLTLPVLGHHPQAAGAERWLSQTLDFEGRGNNGVGYCKGPARFRLFIQGAFFFRRGDKVKPASGDGATAALRTFLNTNVVIGADYYGGKALIQDNMPTQFNASAQRRKGT